MKKMINMLLVVSSLCSLLVVPAAAAKKAEPEWVSWSQLDKQWGSKVICKTSDPVKTMAKRGCLVTAVAKLLCYAGEQSSENFDPGVAADIMLKLKTVNPATGRLVWARFNDEFNDLYAPHLTYVDQSKHYSQKQEKQAAECVKELMEENYFLICQIKKGKDNYHYALVKGANVSKKNVSIEIYDNGGVKDLYNTYPKAVDFSFYKFHYAQEKEIEKSVEIEGAAKINEKTVRQGTVLTLDGVRVKAENTTIQTVSFVLKDSKNKTAASRNIDLNEPTVNAKILELSTKKISPGKYSLICFAMDADGDVYCEQVGSVTIKRAFW